MKDTTRRLLEINTSVIISCDVEPNGHIFDENEIFEGYRVFLFRKSLNKTSAELTALKEEIHKIDAPVVLYIDREFSRGTNFKLARPSSGIIVF